MGLGPKGRERLKRAALVLGAPLLMLLFLEGASSWILFTPDFLRALHPQSQSGQGLKARRDSLLGWVSEPNVHIQDMWGPGVDFRTNSLGFRGRNETTLQPPRGRLRILCSGDSFTMGEGVDDDQNWCALMAAKDSRLETVNLGQAGYGVDQAYLRYERDGHPLQPAVHVLAFITDDFRRMRSGSGKPKLELQEGTLRVRNVPVRPTLSGYVVVRSLVQAAQQLRVVQFSQRLVARTFGGSAETAPYDDTLAQVVSAILADLSGMSQGDNTPLLLVYIPTLGEYLYPSSSTDRWRERLRAEADRMPNTWFLDLWSAFRRLPPDSATRLFIPYQGEQYQRRGFGHLSVLGNEWVADTLLGFLGRVPQIASQLDSLP